MPSDKPADMSTEELDVLTTLLENYNYDEEDLITPIALHAKWWPKLNQLRQAPNKTALLEGWKYKKDLESVEYSHANGTNTHITLESAEQRFVVDLWLCIYH
jgi:hypothetical protein